MTDLRQRAPRQQDDAHLRYVRTQPCCIKFCNRPAEAAHVRMACLAIGKPSTGMQEKPDDKWTVPLCGYHHRTGIGAQHEMGEADFWRMAGLNPFEIAAKLWIDSGGALRDMIPSLRPKPKLFKARKPREQRRKIPAGRKLRSNPVIQSRGFQKRSEERRT